VAIYHRQSLWGQIDHWTRTIRVYDNGRADGDLWDTIMHEVLHGIASELNIKALTDNDCETVIGLLGMALSDVFIRNGWLK